MRHDMPDGVSTTKCVFYKLIHFVSLLVNVSHFEIDSHTIHYITGYRPGIGLCDNLLFLYSPTPNTLMYYDKVSWLAAK